MSLDHVECKNGVCELKKINLRDYVNRVCIQQCQRDLPNNLILFPCVKFLRANVSNLSFITSTYEQIPAYAT